MKRILTLLYIFTCCVYVYAQEYWSQESGRYVNRNYGFEWNLDPDYGFIKGQPRARHTVFRAEGLEGLYQISAFVSPAEVSFDMWTNFEDMKNVISQGLKKGNDGNITKVNYEKVIVSGRHAIKVTYYTDVMDPKYHVSMMMVMTIYYMCESKQNFMINIRTAEIFYNDEIIEDIVSGFKFIKK